MHLLRTDIMRQQNKLVRSIAEHCLVTDTFICLLFRRKYQNALELYFGYAQSITILDIDGFWTTRIILAVPK